jgi:pyruvate/2-oxoglutarate dehydrogenase complex dihydrolipoamide acyltransferase (E2) component
VVIDVVRLAAGQPTIHGLIEVDVTGLRERLAAAPDRPTVTGLLTTVLARAVAACPEVNVRRAGRRLVCFDHVDIAVPVEHRLGEQQIPLPLVVRDAAGKTPGEVTAELRAARDRPVEEPGDLAGASILGLLPSVLRRWGARGLSHWPAAAARFGPPVGLTSLGMFGPGWGVPVSPLTVMVTVGGIVARPVVADGAVAEREFLPLTLSFDHTAVDGAPAARFAQTLRRLLEDVAAGRPGEPADAMGTTLGRTP